MPFSGGCNNTDYYYWISLKDLCNKCQFLSIFFYQPPFMIGFCLKDESENENSNEGKKDVGNKSFETKYSIRKST